MHARAGAAEGGKGKGDCSSAPASWFGPMLKLSSWRFSSSSSSSSSCCCSVLPSPALTGMTVSSAAWTVDVVVVAEGAMMRIWNLCGWVESISKSGCPSAPKRGGVVGAGEFTSPTSGGGETSPKIVGE